MKVEELQEQLISSLPPLFRCDAFGNERFRVRTPLLFPDGDVIDVFVSGTAESYTVTDYGDAAGWLDIRAPARRRSPKQLSLIEDTCQTLGIAIEGGQMVLREVSWKDLADSIVRMAQAEARVGDVWFTMKHTMRGAATAQSLGESTAIDVNRWLRERKLNVETKYELRGNSQRTWSVDFRASSPTRESLVFLLSAAAKQTARNRVHEVVAACLDLSATKERQSQLRFISLFDDTSDTWSNEDYNLLKLQSDVAFWSKRDEFEELLAVES